MDLRRIEDAYMDRLLADVPALGAPLIHGLVGRAVIDLNRAETEIDPGMFRDAPPGAGAERTARVEAGLGCLPRVAFNGGAIYRDKLLWRTARSRIESIHRPYHQALAALLSRAHATFGGAFLIDCHSMPADPDSRNRQVEIVIGDRFGAACGSGFATEVEVLFRKRGYSTARNSPYAGGYSTMAHAAPTSGRHALQIEIRRDLYLSEMRVLPGPGFNKLKKDLTEIAGEICVLARSAVDGSLCSKKKAASDADAAKVIGRKRP